MFLGRSKKSKYGNFLSSPTVQQLYPVNKAIQKVATLARSGDPEAQYRMGQHHLEGERNVVLAVIYLRDAAKNGHLGARLQIAIALMHGIDDPSGIGKSFCLFCSFLAPNISSFDADEPWVMEEVNAGGLTFAYLYCMKKLFSKQEHEAVALLSVQTAADPPGLGDTPQSSLFHKWRVGGLRGNPVPGDTRLAVRRSPLAVGDPLSFRMAESHSQEDTEQGIPPPRRTQRRRPLDRRAAGRRHLRQHHPVGLSLRPWPDIDSAQAGIADTPGRHRVVRATRNSSMFALTEAPQYFPPL